MTVQEYFGDWCKVIDVSMADGIVRKLASSKQAVCPALKDVFKAFTLCSLHDLKVVFLGQDPYCDVHDGIPSATGIAFANAKDVSERGFSPSLDVLMESVIDFTLPHGNITFDPTLEQWCRQGVLMLNSALTCLVGQPGSHALLWRPFIRYFLLSLSAYDTGIIYVLMGREAQSFESCINTRFNHVLKVHHPSWHARTHTMLPHDLWITINNILKGIYGYGIEWFTDNSMSSPTSCLFHQPTKNSFPNP